VDLDNLELPEQPLAAEVTSYAPAAIDVHVEAPDVGYLVLSETWYPGWTATVNGEDTPIKMVNGVFRAVGVPAGTSQVSLHYRALSWIWGLALAAVGLVLVVLAGVVGRRDKRSG
jgi:uncharacterized membrane protein YfhO